MEERLSVRKLDLEYLRFWGIESGFYHSWILLLVPTNSYGCLLLYPQGEEGPADYPTGCYELPLLLDGFWVALLFACDFDLYRLDCRQAHIGF